MRCAANALLCPENTASVKMPAASGSYSLPVCPSISRTCLEGCGMLDPFSVMTPHTVHTAGLLLPLSLVFKLAERDVSGCGPGKGREGGA